MTLAQKQILFQRDLRKLMDFIESKGYTFTVGEVQRTKDQQALYYTQGKTKTLNSQHLKKLACDLFIGKDDFDAFQPTWDITELEEFGDFWESLSPDNQWGGHWKFIDAPHFQRNG